MYSEEAEEKKERIQAREKEQEDLAMSLGGTRDLVEKYRREKHRARLKGIGDRRLKRHLRKGEKEREQASRTAARMELLRQEVVGGLEAEGMEQTRRFRQEEIAAAVPVATAAQYFNLCLDTFGPYSVDYSRNGRCLLLGGRKGHVAVVDWRSKKLTCEFHVHETLRDVQFLHNEMMFAAAQKRYLHVYDSTGMELHCLKQHLLINSLCFLPYHFLLVSASERGSLHYLDTSTGQLVAEHKVRLGPLRCIAQNPHNAAVHLGHVNGTVSLWTPNIKTAQVKMLCHRGPVMSVAIDKEGWSMVTAGMDALVKVWDVRTFKPLHSYRSPRPALALDVSQRGLLAASCGRLVQVWRGGLRGRSEAPYLQHSLSGDGSSLQFVPFEDCLGVGHSSGVSSLIVPGAGEPNFDALELNPFESKKQRREGEVKQLLEKIPAELITLDADDISKVEQGGREGEGGEEGEEGGAKGRRGSGVRLSKRKAAERESKVLNKRRHHMRQKRPKAKQCTSSSANVLDRFR